VCGGAGAAKQARVPRVQLRVGAGLTKQARGGGLYRCSRNDNSVVGLLQTKCCPMGKQQCSFCAGSASQGDGLTGTPGRCMGHSAMGQGPWAMSQHGGTALLRAVGKLMTPLHAEAAGLAWLEAAGGEGQGPSIQVSAGMARSKPEGSGACPLAAGEQEQGHTASAPPCAVPLGVVGWQRNVCAAGGRQCRGTCLSVVLLALGEPC